MAEAALFSLASNLLSKIATPAFERAYERARSAIWGARDELQELRDTITTIRAVLIDAETKRNDSAQVRNLIQRVRDVLYDAEDLFDFVATDDILKQRQIKGKKHGKEVRVFFSKLNPIASNDFIAKKVKAIRKDLRKISDDMALFGFVRCENEKPVSGMGRGVETGSVVGPNEIIGRDEEKQQVIEFLCDVKYSKQNISLIAVVGIGGMGKSALAQLIYNDARVEDGFQERRYWACISDIIHEKEVWGKIYQSMTKEGNYQGFNLDQFQSGIKNVIDGKGRFLLVLDDLWDEDKAAWSNLRSRLSSDGAKGSKIIITTRDLSVAKGMKADQTLELKGLSSDASWDLFKRFAFAKEQEKDPAWISLGEKIVKKCVNVPLAIKSVGSLLRRKDTIEEWKSFENEELSKIEGGKNPIMSTLRLSYDHLPSYLKNCFAYCSLFPKDTKLRKDDLIFLWIAQGYVKPKNDETLEAAGHAYFMELYRRSFFQEARTDDQYGGIKSCKMHDLVHDLAQDVAGEETTILVEGMDVPHKKIRHLLISYEIDESRRFPPSLLEVDRLRSLVMGSSYNSSRAVDQELKKLRFLRVYAGQGFTEAPVSIGELKHLRYLDLSRGDFSHLPDSITKLVNLITLDISWCKNLVELPRDIGELTSLRHLINKGCEELREMPVSFGELTSLERLSEIRVGNSGLEALARISLHGNLNIIYDEECREEVMLERGQISNNLESLNMRNYPSKRLPAWWRDDPASRLPKLEHLVLYDCKQVKQVAPLRCLPFLKFLHIEGLDELEYMEEEDESVISTPQIFFPSLQTLVLRGLWSLKGWWSSLRPRQVLNQIPRENVSLAEQPSLMFPLLTKLELDGCTRLISVPLAPHLKSLYLCDNIRLELVDQMVSTYSASSSAVTSSTSSVSPSSSIEDFSIGWCDGLTSFSGKGLTSLRTLKIFGCLDLRRVEVAPHNVVEELEVRECPQLQLWEKREEKEKTSSSSSNISIDWDSFANLRLLEVYEIPKQEGKLPDCLQHLISIGQLQLKKHRCVEFRRI